MSIIDPEAPVKSQLRWYLLGGGVVVLAGILYFVFSTSPTRTIQPNEHQLTDNPLESARQALSRETDLDTCRSALTQLNDYLAKHEAQQAAEPTPEEEKTLRERCGLERDELAEISGGTFTQLDAHYLELCFLLRDAAASLDVEIFGKDDGQRRPTPLRQAQAAFGWAVRQVRLEKSDAPTLPAQFILRRGSGTPIERALVFLELLRHVGTADEKLTGCLVYCPDKTGTQHLWACGVLVNDKPDVYLFDPRLGLPLPGPKGKGIATLSEARTDKAVLEQLNVTDASRYDVTADQAAQAELRYVCSLSSLAQRMRVLESSLLPPTVKVRVFVDYVAETNRLLAASSTKKISPWRDDKASGAGVLRRFLPVTEGGTDAETVRRLNHLDSFRQALIPWNAMPPYFQNQSRFPRDVGLGQRVFGTFAKPFLELSLQPHRARDELLRGHFNTAVRELVELRRLAREAEDRLPRGKTQQQEHTAEIDAWIEQAVQLYAAQLAERNPQKLDEINGMIEDLWKKAGALFVLLEGTRAFPLRRELSYQLALCKHEQAERQQLQSELDPDDKAQALRAMDAWKEAVNLWQQYLAEYSHNPFAGNVGGGACRLLGRAQWFSGDRAGAIHTWRLDLPTSALEKVGNWYLAKQNAQ